MNLIKKYKIKILLMVILIVMSVVIILFGKKFSNEKNVDYVNKNIYDNSQSSIVMNMKNNEILYQNNINQKMLPASTTKILTCITAIENYDLNDLVVVDKKSLNVEGSKIYLEDGDVISINDLLYGLMLCSGNDAANIIANHLSGISDDFIVLMNNLKDKIGMKSSLFNNPHGLDSENKNITTVYDMALLMSYAMKNETFKKITSTRTYNPVIASGKKMFFKNKHKLIQNFEYATGGKTGFTKLARRTLVTSFMKDNIEIVVVTFNCGDDFYLHEKLANYYLNKEYE